MAIPEVVLSNVLTTESMSAVNAKIEILQESIDTEGQIANNGVMKIRVPFYVSGSTSKVSGLSTKVHWGDKALDTIIQEGTAQIAAKKQPLTVYPRHSHALSGHELPCGDVVQLERSGRLGMATIEVAPTSIGKDVQVLARTGKLNAVSLRSRKGDYVLADAILDGEPVLVCERVGMAGIDFAPDDPSQETFGIEILNENDTPVMDVVPPEDPDPATDKGRHMADDTPLTLESLRSDHPALVAEIEKSVKDELESVKAQNFTLTQEVATFKVATEATELTNFIESVAVKSSDPETFRKHFSTLCQEKDIKTVAQATPHVVPLLLDALDAAKADAPVEPKKSTQSLLAELFPSKGDGSGVPGANGKPKEGDEIVLTQEQASEVAARTTVGGLVLPGGI